MANNGIMTLRGHHLRLLYQHYIKGAPLQKIRAQMTETFGEEVAANAINALSKIIRGGYEVILTD